MVPKTRRSRASREVSAQKSCALALKSTNHRSQAQPAQHLKARHVFGIPELRRRVVDMVAKELPPGHERSPKRGQVLKILISLACVDKNFSGDALNVLWRTLHNTTPLLRRLPSDAWNGWRAVQSYFPRLVSRSCGLYSTHAADCVDC